MSQIYLHILNGMTQAHDPGLCHDYLKQFQSRYEIFSLGNDHHRGTDDDCKFLRYECAEPALIRQTSCL